MRTADRRIRGWAEACLLGALAIVPLAAHFAYYAAHPIGRFSVGGDFALLELAAKRAWTGEILVGPYSRFRFSHPGPLYFYLLAPLYAAFSSSTTIHVGATVLNGAAAFGVVVAVHRLASRAYALSFVAGLLAFWSAFGNIASNPWNPLVIALPLFALLTLAALLANGATRLAVPVALLAALVSQTHLAAVPTAFATVAVAYGAAAYEARGSERAPLARRRLLWGLFAGLVSYLPPLYEQFTSPEGNLTKLFRFFVTRAAPTKPLSEVLVSWSIATAWLPRRAFRGALLADGWPPLAMRWDAIPTTLEPAQQVWVAAYVLLVVCAFAIAKKRRDVVGLALLAASTGANALAIVALRAVVGETFHYLVFWTTAASALGWVGVAGVLARASVEWVARAWPRAARPLYSAVIAVIALEEWLAASEQRSVLAAFPPASTHLAWFKAARDAVRARADRQQATPIVHLDGDWWGAKALMLELAKDGVDARPAERDRWVFGRVAHAKDVARPLHVYVDSPSLPLPVKVGLEQVDLPDGTHVYFASDEIAMPPR